MPRLLLVFTFLAILLPTATVRADVVADREALYEQYREKLERLAKQCETENLPAAAKALRNWLPTRAPDQITLFVPPSATTGESAEASPADRVEWQGLRNQQADALMALARQAVSEGHSTLTYPLVVEALRENPNHERARKMLGYRMYQGSWHTPFEIRQLRAGKVWHDEFGWIPKSHLPRYQQGERNALGRWMTADDEASLRQDIKRGWRIETDHYIVTTNHSQAEGVRLARQIEKLHGLWRQVFAPYLISDDELIKQLDGKAPRPLPRQHDVVYLRTRDEYNAALRAAQPQIEITLGIYFDTTRTAYFFAGEDQDAGTLYHEATHQLFQETRNVSPQVGRQHNFWIVEGIACYMESLTEHDGYYTLGGMNSGRVPAARHRLLVDGFYVPLAELVSLGRDDLQRDPRIAMLYSQSSGLTDFFMQAEAGRRRDALVKYISLLYAGRANAGTLAEVSSQPYEQLDSDYRNYISADAPADPATQAAR